MPEDHKLLEKKGYNYCPYCGKKIRFGTMDILNKIVGSILTIALVIAGIFGVVFLIQLYYEPAMLWIGISRIQSVSTTRLAHTYDERVEVIANNITDSCVKQMDEEYGNETVSESLIKSFTQRCQITESKKYLKDNFEYEYDYEMGFRDISINMITEYRNKGDCDDWSVTFCSLMYHMNVSCIVLSTGNHYLTAVRDGTTWDLIEPQGGGNALKDNMFQGYLV